MAPDTTVIAEDTVAARYRTLSRIRAFERMLLDNYGRGLFRGTTHTCLGQEANAAAVMANIQGDDAVFSNHRGHGHYLAYCEDFDGLLAEIAGTTDGVCGGFGGSQHLQRDGFYSNGILGGMVPVATGAGLAHKLGGGSGIAVCFLGDGALGEGIVYESFNMASLWQIPVLFVVENNRMAQSTAIERNLAGDIAARPRAFGIETAVADSRDPDALFAAAALAVDHVRTERAPYCLVIDTARLGPHSKGDDTRGEAELARCRDADPLQAMARGLPAETARQIEADAAAEIDTIWNRFTASNRQTAAAVPPAQTAAPAARLHTGGPATLLQHLNGALHEIFAADPDALMIGEDIADPYGGAFKVTKDLESRHPDRVFTSPISEAGIVGLANGLALRGRRPFVEIMFGDFTTLIVDQVVNHMTKFAAMYHGKAACPVVVRTPMGGYRGYGPTHSQSLEKLFIGVPGLNVVAADIIHDQASVLAAIHGDAAPCIFVENKTAYGEPMLAFADGRVDKFFAASTGAPFPVSALQLTNLSEAPDVCLLAYGGMVKMAMETATRLFIDEELIVRVVVPTRIAPVPTDDIAAQAGACRTFVTLEEGTVRGGWGSEVVAALTERLDQPVRCRRIAAGDGSIPVNAELEAEFLPSVERCARTILDLF